MGIPGASTFKSEWIEYLQGHDVYIHNEGDKAGDGFVKSICKYLSEANFKNKIAF